MTSSPHDIPLNLPSVRLLIPNMHCPSCCEAITQLLAPLSSVKNLSISLLLHTITFAVDTSISSSHTPGSIQKVIKDVKAILVGEGGFVILEEDGSADSISNNTRPSTSRWWSRSGWDGKQTRAERRAKERRKRHLEHCEACQRDEEIIKAGGVPMLPTATGHLENEDIGGGITKTVLSIDGMTCASCTGSITSALKSHPSILGVEINLLSSSGTIRHRSTLRSEDVVELVQDSGFEAEVISSLIESSPSPSGEPDDEKKSTFSIEGMTCASCSSAITSSLQALQGVKTVNIDLLGNRGVIVHNSATSDVVLKDAIEDIGYGAELLESVLVSPKPIDKGKQKADPSRTITVRVQGIFCGTCIAQLNNHLATLRLLSFTPFSMSAPFTSLKYIPHEPLTIRDIVASISNVAPEFEAEVIKTQSLSERSQVIQRKEFVLLASHLAIAVLFAIPTFIVAIVGMVILPGHSDFRMMWMQPVWGAANLGTIVLWPLATIVQFGVGRLFYQRAMNSIWPHVRGFIPSCFRPDSMKNLPSRPWTWRSPFSFGSMDLLVVLSTSVSYFASIAMLILDVRAISMSDSIGTYFDSCVFLIMFILLGRTLESYAKSRTTDAVSLLGSLRPDTALLVESPSVEDLQKVVSQSTQSSVSDEAVYTHSSRAIPVEQLEIGDLIVVQPGSLPPTDGVIVNGSTAFDESSLTGESKAVAKAFGDEVFTGTINKTSAITIRVTSLASDTMLERIIHAVSDASSRKAPLEKLAERLTGIFVPLIIYLSIIVLVIWLSLALTNSLSDDDFSGRGGRVFFAIEFAISCLVVACPCGIGLAVPCANAVGNGIAASAGILASGGGEAFLAATKVDRIVFDKTGTLTQGKSVVTDHDFVGQLEGKGKILKAILEIERLSTHPLAVGVVEYLCQQKVDDGRVDILESEEIAGRGVKAIVQQDGEVTEVLIGNASLMTENGISILSPMEETINAWASQAKSVIIIASRSQQAPKTIAESGYTLQTVMSLSDPPRETTVNVLAALRRRGFKLSMLSGDNAVTAKAVAKIIGIPEEDVRAGVGPEGKADAIRDFQGIGNATNTKKQVVMFVGDGLNDSVALAAADVSVAMGHGSQATLASADFVLLNSSLDTLLPLLRISKKVYNRQRLNLAWALIFNIVCLPFASGAFYPLHGIRLSPVWSAVIMALSSVSVVCSSLALRWGL